MSMPISHPEEGSALLKLILTVLKFHRW